MKLNPPIKGLISLPLRVGTGSSQPFKCAAEPFIEIVCPLQGKPQCLPQLAWHHVVIEHRDKMDKTAKKMFIVNPVSYDIMTYSRLKYIAVLLLPTY